MKKMFIEKQPREQQDNYASLLQAVGSISGLFSDSPNPYLYYRAAERAFCKAFDADDLSREDSSYDAKKSGLGIGLKTFLYKKGNCMEKVAEFNSASNILRSLQNTPEELITKVAQLRNKRIEFTKNTHGLDNGIYHCVARDKGKFSLFECPLVPVNIDKIKINRKSLNSNTLSFSDDLNEYKFSLSKSTLFKRFMVKEDIITDIPISVLDDPFELIQKLTGDIKRASYHKIILPLYSKRDGIVPIKSGLNKWNALGRDRDENEAEIRIQTWISKRFFDFFPERSKEFELVLPDGNTLQASCCEDGGEVNGVKVGKALTTNPNKALGKWILRDILKLTSGKICTLEMLEELGIDSVEITKISLSKYKINFAPLGSYQEFYDTYRE